MKKIPELNKTYNCFDDGKISKSRLYEVEVRLIVPFNEIDKKTLDIWKTEVKQCYWLYNEKTDFFIITDNGEEDDNEEIFVRTKDNGWFSIGGFMGCGSLDVDGELTKLLNENLKQ